MFNQSQNQSKKKQSYVNDNVLEALRGISSSVGKTVAKDVIGKTTEDVFSSLLGSTTKPNEFGTFGEELPVNERAQRYSAYHPETQVRPMVKVEESGIKQQIESVRTELAALSKSVAELNLDIKKAIMESPVDPGIYHINFLERLRSIILLLRQHIDESRTWLNLHTSRKKKQGYWGMYKKHGTTFGLSNERTIATQAG